MLILDVDYKRWEEPGGGWSWALTPKGEVKMRQFRKMADLWLRWLEMEDSNKINYDELIDPWTAEIQEL